MNPTRTARRRTILSLAVASAFASGEALAAAGDRIGDAILVDASIYETHPAVGRDAAGEFVVAWDQNGEILARLFAADGTAAGPAFDVGRSARHEPPRVAMRADGGFVIAWTRDSDNGPERGLVLSPKSSAYARRFAPGGVAQGDAFLVADLGDRVDVAMDDDGDFVIGWAADRRHAYLQFGYPLPTRDLPTPGLASIKLQRFRSDGKPAGPAQTLNEQVLTGDAPSNSIAVAMTPDGAYSAVYSLKKLGAPVSTIYAQSFNANGRAAGKTLQVSDGVTDSGGATAATNRSGDLVVAWNDANGAQFKAFTSAGAVRFPQASPFGDVASTSRYAAAGVAVDASGNIVIVGSPPYALAPGSVVTRDFAADGTPISSTKPVAPSNGFLQTEAAVAVDGQGRAVAAWTNYAILSNIQSIQSQSIGAQRLAGP